LTSPASIIERVKTNYCSSDYIKTVMILMHD